MDKKNLLALIVLFASIKVLAQPSIEWQKSLGGTDFDLVESIKQTTDGGYILCGSSSSSDGDVISNHGQRDSWVVKITSSGEIDWQNAIGGTGLDTSNSIEQTIDEGYIVAGSSQSNDGDVTGNHGNHDFWVVKFSSTGVINWQKSIGGSGNDIANSVKQTVDGGYIVCGRSQSSNGDVTVNHGGYDFWMVKLTDSGVIEWQKSLGGSNDDIATSIGLTNDGGYIITGYSYSHNGDVTNQHGESDYWVVKITNMGNIEWQKSLGGSDSDFASDIKQTTDGGYIIAGYSLSTDGDITNSSNGSIWVVKLSQIGIIEWQKSIGGIGASAFSIQQTDDYGFIVAGKNYMIDGSVLTDNIDALIVKLSETGSIEWQKPLGGTQEDVASSIQQTNDNGYVVAIRSASSDGDVLGNHGFEDYWVVKLSSSLGINDFSNANFILHPNPTTGILNITSKFPISKIKIFDNIGHTVKLDFNNSIIDISKLKLGIYFMTIEDIYGNFETKKIIKI
ncbi:MAG: T9SS type A sorting domain-containing protein [Gelidibacter sp.]